MPLAYSSCYGADNQGGGGGGGGGYGDDDSHDDAEDDGDDGNECEHRTNPGTVQASIRRMLAELQKK
jgi:hypothetical protein